MFQTYRQIWSLLSRTERRRFILLIFATIVMAAFEVAGVGVILPFLSVVSDPTVVDRNALLARFADLFGLQTPQALMIGVGAAAFALIVVGMGVRALVTYMQFRFALMRSYSLGSRLLHGYLAQDYVRQISRNSAELATSILSEVDQVVRESILPGVLLISNTVVVLMIAGLLFAVAPGVALGATGLLGIIYIGVFGALRRRLVAVGQARIAANRARFLTVQEITGGFKELKVTGLEARSLQRYRAPAQALAHNQTRGQVMIRLPRFALEATVYGGFILMVLVMILWRGDAVADLIPLFGLLGMAATRLFPAMQNLYQYMGQMRLSAPAVVRLQNDLAEAELHHLPAIPPAPLPLRTAISLRDVGFSYPAGERTVLDTLSLRIPARTSVGFVGGTGAGKTTVIDLILGLLSPTSGDVLIDDVPLTSETLRAWQRNIGYVPQHIFLIDDTVAANIAFGAGREGIDQEAVERVARIANLHDFVTTELPEGYATRVGERGVRLSGGQRQRIGIARALYRDPEVLILDEATSALDTITERAVMAAVEGLAGTKTVIMIAHRLSTVKDCDTIFLLEQGKVVAQGSYEALVSESDVFRRMAAN